MEELLCPRSLFAVSNGLFAPTCVQWKEAEEKEFHLQSEKKASALSDASRKWFLRQETSAALEHEGEWTGPALCQTPLHAVTTGNATALSVTFIQIMLGGQ